MSIKTDTQLNTSANIIKTETVTGANTASRIGVMLNDIIDSKINVGQLSTTTSLGTSDTLVPSQKAVKTYVDNHGVITVKTSLTSSDILALNTTPITLVEAQGSGTIIQPLSIVLSVDYGTAAYATNTTLQIKYQALPGNMTTSTIISATQDTIVRTLPNTTLTFTSLPINTPLVVDVASGDPTAGDGTLDIYVSYVVITL